MVVDPGMPDEQLVLRSSRGDREAFAELYARYFQGLYDLIFRMVRDPEMAADLVQNCFIQAWGSLQKRTVSGNVRAWLYAIARNTAINEIRRKKRWGAVVVSEPSREDSTAFEGIDTSRLSNPEDALEAKELVDLVWESAAALGPKEYSLLDLHLRRDLAPGE
ncbi:MAG TPA: sigma-70 family RNA polymerase sigma factor, partial [Arthrobacter sp.]